VATRLPSVDVVIIGVGWGGSIFAKELTDLGLRVVGLERGGNRDTSTDFRLPNYNRADELRYAHRGDLFQNLSRDTVTFRHTTHDTALPMRQLGSFLPGEGLGGAGVHWNGQNWRFLPWDFETRSQTLRRYGAKALPPDNMVADWGVTYADLEPYMDKWEYLCGISGKAGNIQGKIQPGGNPFEGPRQRDFPNPPLTPSYGMTLFQQAAAGLGYHPFFTPAANSSQPYTNTYGVQLGGCLYCGFCERFGCEAYAKASPMTCVFPVLLPSPHFDLRTHTTVTRLNLDNTRRRVTSVTYVDAQGLEYEQPADLVLLTAWTLNNVRLLLVSGIGTPYNPSTGEGVVGRNYAYQAGTGATMFFENQVFNPFMGSGALQMAIDDFNGDNFNHAGLGFIGGGSLTLSSTGARPIDTHPTPVGTPRWGSAWKTAVAHYYQRFLGMGVQAGVLAYRGNYLDLDPTYRDAFGLPLLRMTFDWGPNEHAVSRYMVPVLQRLASAMKADKVSVGPLSAHYSIVPYQSTHNTGGVIMGTDPRASAVNKYLQMWDVPNLFVVGASAYPQNAGYNPTGTLGGLIYWTVDALKNKYLKHPGPLVS